MNAKRLFIAFGLLLVVILITALFIPPNMKSLASHPHPSQDYPAALDRLEALQNRNVQALNPDCRPQVLDHGKRVDQVIVFIHGYPVCPKQFAPLAGTFYQQGHNVLNLPLPRHGLLDRMNNQVEKLRAEELVAYADETIDIAQGLGERVTVVGFSAGGAVTGWIAQNRGDVESVVMISPGFDLQPIPTRLALPAARLVLALPNINQWFDPEKKEQGGQPHGYPRYSTHALAQLLRLGSWVQAEARNSPPQVRAITIVTNANDPNINNEMAEEIGRLWSEHGAQVTLYEFDRSLGLAHEIIDPTHPYSRTDIVYPRLIPLIQEALEE